MYFFVTTSEIFMNQLNKLIKIYFILSAPKCFLMLEIYSVLFPILRQLVAFLPKRRIVILFLAGAQNAKSQ